MESQNLNSPGAAAPSHVPVAASLALSKWMVLLSLTIAAVLAYANSVRAPFVFGDWSLLWGDDTIKAVGSALAPQASSELAGRPLTALTFALNFALSGENPASFRILNIALHAVAAFLLWLLVRETLAASPRVSSRLKDARHPIAFATAFLWVAHPLNTEAIVYISRRTEQLSALGLLLMLWALGRGLRSQRPAGWLSLSALAGIAGALCGDLAWAAPVLAFLFAAFFFNDSFQQTWQRARIYWLSLGSIWMTALWAAHASVQRQFAFSSLTEFGAHLLASAKGLAVTLKLSFWPHALQFDYGRTPVASISSIWAELTVVVVVLIAACIGIWRRAPFGFIAASIILLLAPAALVAPVIKQPIAEHRAYLVTAVLACMAIVLLHRLTRRATPWLAAVAAVGLGFFTHERNQVYAVESGLWEDSIIKNPLNARAFLCRAVALERERNPVDALSCYELALIVDPDYAEGHYTYGRRLAKNPARQDEAISHLRDVVRLKPTWIEAHLDLGNALLKQPKLRAEAISTYEAAHKLKPDSPEIRINLANALAHFPERLPEAIAHFAAAAKLAPQNAHLHYSWGNALVKDPSHWAAARERFEKALLLDPKIPGCHYNLAVLLSKTPTDTDRAVSHYREAVKLAPDYIEAHYNLALLLRKIPATRGEAIAHFKEVLRIDPSMSQASEMIAKTETM